SFRFLAVNDAALEYFGYSRDQALGMTVLDLFPENERGVFRQSAATSEGKVDLGRPWCLAGADGSEVSVEIYARSLEYGGHSARIVAAIDITERKHADDERRSAEEFLNTVIENVPSPI